MILIALALICAATVPLRGGSLARLADLRLRGLWIPTGALILQVGITVLVTGGSPLAHRLLQIATYAMIALFLWLNRRLAGVAVVSLGAGLNALAILANGGVMPASASAERIAGVHLRAGFNNSAHLPHEWLPFLGDVLPWPGPLHNVLSIGDLIIFAGTFVLLQKACGRSAPRPIALRPITE